MHRYLHAHFVTISTDSEKAQHVVSVPLSPTLMDTYFTYNQAGKTSVLIKSAGDKKGARCLHANKHKLLALPECAAAQGDPRYGMGPYLGIPDAWPECMPVVPSLTQAKDREVSVVPNVREIAAAAPTCTPDELTDFEASFAGVFPDDISEDEIKALATGYYHGSGSMHVIPAEYKLSMNRLPQKALQHARHPENLYQLLHVYHIDKPVTLIVDSKEGRGSKFKSTLKSMFTRTNKSRYTLYCDIKQVGAATLILAAFKSTRTLELLDTDDIVKLLSKIRSDFERDYQEYRILADLLSPEKKDELALKLMPKLFNLERCPLEQRPRLLALASLFLEIFKVPLHQLPVSVDLESSLLSSFWDGDLPMNKFEILHLTRYLLSMDQAELLKNLWASPRAVAQFNQHYLIPEDLSGAVPLMAPDYFMPQTGSVAYKQGLLKFWLNNLKISLTHSIDTATQVLLDVMVKSPHNAYLNHADEWNVGEWLDNLDVRDSDNYNYPREAFPFSKLIESASFISYLNQERLSDGIVWLIMLMPKDCIQKLEKSPNFNQKLLDVLTSTLSASKSFKIEYLKKMGGLFFSTQHIPESQDRRRKDELKKEYERLAVEFLMRLDNDRLHWRESLELCTFFSSSFGEMPQDFQRYLLQNAHVHYRTGSQAVAQKLNLCPDIPELPPGFHDMALRYRSDDILISDADASKILYKKYSATEASEFVRRYKKDDRPLDFSTLQFLAAYQFIKKAPALYMNYLATKLVEYKAVLERMNAQSTEPMSPQDNRLMMNALESLKYVSPTADHFLKRPLPHAIWPKPAQSVVQPTLNPFTWYVREIERIINEWLQFSPVENESKQWVVKELGPYALDNPRREWVLKSHPWAVIDYKPALLKLGKRCWTMPNVRAFLVQDVSRMPEPIQNGFSTVLEALPAQETD